MSFQVQTLKGKYVCHIELEFYRWNLNMTGKMEQKLQQTRKWKYVLNLRGKNRWVKLLVDGILFRKLFWPTVRNNILYEIKMFQKN